MWFFLFDGGWLATLQLVVAEVWGGCLGLISDFCVSPLGIYFLGLFFFCWEFCTALCDKLLVPGCFILGWVGVVFLGDLGEPVLDFSFGWLDGFPLSCLTNFALSPSGWVSVFIPWRLFCFSYNTVCWFYP